VILHHVVVYPTECRLQALVEEPAGKMRRIEFAWFARHAVPTPPPHWWTAVQAEVEFQRTHEAEVARGRVLP